MPDVGISLEALAVLLFCAFVIPGTCCALLIVRGMIRGYRVQQSHRLLRNAYERRLLQ